jgi:hypothetical protein
MSLQIWQGSMDITKKITIPTTCVKLEPNNWKFIYHFIQYNLARNIKSAHFFLKKIVPHLEKIAAAR